MVVQTLLPIAAGIAGTIITHKALTGLAGKAVGDQPESKKRDEAFRKLPKKQQKKIAKEGGARFDSALKAEKTRRKEAGEKKISAKEIGTLADKTFASTFDEMTGVSKKSKSKKRRTVSGRVEGGVNR